MTEFRADNRARKRRSSFTMPVGNYLTTDRLGSTRLLTDKFSSGNTTADAEGRTFVYDAENKQVEVIESSVIIGEYLYDGDGKRVEKIAGLEETIFVCLRRRRKVDREYLGHRPRRNQREDGIYDQRSSRHAQNKDGQGGIDTASVGRKIRYISFGLHMMMRVAVVVLRNAWILIFLGVITVEDVRPQRPVTARPAPPQEEEFVPRDEILFPWRESGCGANPSMPEPFEAGVRCDVNVAERAQAHLIELYDGRGSLWLGLTLDDDDFPRKAKERLKPLGFGHDYEVYLRLVGESANWHKVEVDDESKEIKFAPKTARMWAKASWYTLFNRHYKVLPDQKTNKLRDAPSGEIIREAENSALRLFRFLKLDGDWVLVSCVSETNDKHTGWIRWREGRKILVGWVGNKFKIPSGF